MKNMKEKFMAKIQSEFNDCVSELINLENKTIQNVTSASREIAAKFDIVDCIIDSIENKEFSEEEIAKLYQTEDLLHKIYLIYQRGYDYDDIYDQVISAVFCVI